jgi:regulator of RNase E activity RraA
VNLEKLKNLDSCTVSNAIERLNVRLRNEGFIPGVARWRFPKLPPMVGYAVMPRFRCYYDRMDWWKYVVSLSSPRIMVLQDANHNAGLGAFVGEIHAAIGLALNCDGCVTNGAVRDLAAVEAMGFQMYASHTSVSHAYAHNEEFGEPVEIGGLKTRQAICRIEIVTESLTSHCRSRQKFPQKLPKSEMTSNYRSPRFSLRELAERIQIMNLSGNLTWRDGK